MTDRKELLERAQSIEESLHPYDLVVDGAPIWPVLRVTVCNRSLRGEMKPTGPPPRSGAGKNLRTLGHGALQWRRSRLSARPGGLLFLTERTYWTQSTQGTTDRFALPLMQAASELGVPATLVVKDPVANALVDLPEGTITIRLDEALRARALHHWRRPVEPLRHIPGSGPVIEALASSYAKEPVAFLAKAVHGFRMHLRTWRSALRAFRPDHVFVTCWYAVENMAIAQAAHELGIPCTDVQHGVQGPAHFAYGSWMAMPSTGCSTIPSHFWCWDAGSADNIRSWAPAGHHRAFVGGAPWIEEHGLAPGQRTSGALRVLVTLQPVARPIPAVLTEAIRQMGNGCHWTIRTHPRAAEQAEQARQWAKEEGLLPWITVEGAEAEPIGSSLAGTDVHLTLYSSVALEASLCGVPTIALDPLAGDLFPDLLGNGSLVIRTSSEALVAELARTPANGMHRTTLPPLRERVQGFLARTSTTVNTR